MPDRHGWCNYEQDTTESSNRLYLHCPSGDFCSLREPDAIACRDHSSRAWRNPSGDQFANTDGQPISRSGCISDLYTPRNILPRAGGFRNTHLIDPNASRHPAGSNSYFFWQRYAYSDADPSANLGAECHPAADCYSNYHDASDAGDWC